MKNVTEVSKQAGNTNVTDVSVAEGEMRLKLVWGKSSIVCIIPQLLF